MHQPHRSRLMHCVVAVDVTFLRFDDRSGSVVDWWRFTQNFITLDVHPQYFILHCHSNKSLVAWLLGLRLGLGNPNTLPG